MPSKNLDWTTSNPDRASSALVSIGDIIQQYGMQLTLEALIHHVELTAGITTWFGAETDYLLDLRVNLERALNEYKGRHNEFG